MTTARSSKTVKLGATGPEVFPLALGCMGMGASSFYGDSDEAESCDEIAAIEAAVPASQVAGTRYAEPLMKHLDSERQPDR